jgi:hypothetical protein
MQHHAEFLFNGNVGIEEGDEDWDEEEEEGDME